MCFSFYIFRMGIREIREGERGKHVNCIIIILFFWGVGIWFILNLLKTILTTCVSLPNGHHTKYIFVVVWANWLLCWNLDAIQITHMSVCSCLFLLKEYIESHTAKATWHILHKLFPLVIVFVQNIMILSLTLCYVIALNKVHKYTVTQQYNKQQPCNQKSQNYYTSEQFLLPPPSFSLEPSIFIHRV